MGCGCGGGGAAARQEITKYVISDDPQQPKRQYLTQAEATAQKAVRNLSGEVQPVTTKG